MPKIWIDGAFYEKDEARISVFDHAVLYGDGVFEGLRSYNGHVFRLRQHIERLRASAHAILLEVPMAPDAMAAMVEECVRVNGLTDAYVRLVVTRGVGDLGLDPRNCPKATVICIAAGITLWPPEKYEKGLTVITVPTPVNQPHGLSPLIKSLNYLSHIMAKFEAINAGADEALLLDASGHVAEGSGQNLFCVKDGVLRTTPGYFGILRGITRGAVIELAADAGYELREEPLSRYDIYTADEAFLTGTAAEIVGITKYDARVIGSGVLGPVTRDISRRFKDLTSRGG